jgi:hypothetical protein
MTQPDEVTQGIKPRQATRDPEQFFGRVVQGSKPERVLRIIREVMSIIALLLASILMVLLLATIGAIGKRLSETTEPVLPPVPSWTCGPSGEEVCAD